MITNRLIQLTDSSRDFVFCVWRNKCLDYPNCFLLPCVHLRSYLTRTTAVSPVRHSNSRQQRQTFAFSWPFHVSYREDLDALLPRIAYDLVEASDRVLHV